MKVFLGLLLWIIGFASVLCFKTRLRLTAAEFTAALCFVFFCGALLAFYDRVRSLKVFGGGVEFAEQRINQATDNAVARIATEVEKHAESISRLSDQALEQAAEAFKQQARIEHIASGEPVMTMIDGRARPVMIYTDECGRKYADITDKEGECKRVYFKE